MLHYIIFKYLSNAPTAHIIIFRRFEFDMWFLYIVLYVLLIIFYLYCKILLHGNTQHVFPFLSRYTIFLATLYTPTHFFLFISYFYPQASFRFHELQHVCSLSFFPFQFKLAGFLLSSIIIDRRVIFRLFFRLEKL